MRIQFDEFIKLIPEHFKKEDTLKFFRCLQPIFDYLDLLMEETIGKSNIDKATGEYLDYIGNKESAFREGRVDEQYRTFILANRFIKNNAPTTENLIKLAKKMTGYNPSNVVTNYNNEPASQLIEFDVPYSADVNNFPDFNNYCDAGARIIQTYLQPGIMKDFYFGVTEVNISTVFETCNIV